MATETPTTMATTIFPSMDIASSPAHLRPELELRRIRACFQSGHFVHPFGPDERPTTDGPPPRPRGPVVLDFVQVARIIAKACGSGFRPWDTSPTVEKRHGQQGEGEENASASRNNEVDEGGPGPTTEVVDHGGVAATTSPHDPAIDSTVRRGPRTSNYSDREKKLDALEQLLVRSQHVVLVLCDGLGMNVLREHFRPGEDDDDDDSFILRHANKLPRCCRDVVPGRQEEGSPAARQVAGRERGRVRGPPADVRFLAVFPPATPNALTSLATGCYPGRHGAPGWNLRCQKAGPDGCELPNGRVDPVQIKVLDRQCIDARTGLSLRDLGWGVEEIFLVPAWTEEGAQADAPLAGANGGVVPAEHKNVGGHLDDHQHSTYDPREQAGVMREMLYVNAYNKSGFTNYYQGFTPSSSARRSSGHRTVYPPFLARPSHVTLASIPETALDTLDTPEGPEIALEAFAQASAEISEFVGYHRRETRKKTYSYFYTAHPDKHMHHLGVEHEFVRTVVRGIDAQIDELWSRLVRMQADDESTSTISSASPSGGRGPTTMIMLADHGHVSVPPGDNVLLPDDILDTLEYATVSVTGVGRQAYLRVKAGYAGPSEEFENRWYTHKVLVENFCLISTKNLDHKLKLFGPDGVDVRLKPRLGDYMAISLGRKSLATPEEFAESLGGRIRGGHGSLLREEMEIPLVVLTTEDGMESSA